MENISKLSKILQTISIFSFIIWFGSYLTRQMACYHLFDLENISVQPDFSEEALKGFFTFLLPALTISVISYISFLLTFLIFIFVSKINLKIHGWLFIAFLIILLTAPLECFLVYYDINIISSLLHAQPVVDQITTLIKERMEIFGSFPIIEMFLYLGVTILYIFKPLTHSTK